MAGGDLESDKGTGSLEDNDKDTDQEGRNAAGVPLFLQSRPPLVVALRYRDMSGYPLHGTSPGGLPILGDTTTDRAAATAEVGREMGIHFGRGGERECRVRCNENLHSEKSEYGRTVYCDTANYGPVQGCGEEVGEQVGMWWW